MSKVKTVQTPAATEEEKPHLALVEVDENVLPAPVDTVTIDEDDETEEVFDAKPNDLVVYLDSLGVSMLDCFSLVRVFREEWRSKIARYRSEEGGNLSLDQAVEKATHKIDEQRAAEIFEKVLTYSSESVDFDDLHKLWVYSPEDAEFVWSQMKREARREFMTGHLAATVFEPVDWMRSAWKRAKFLGVRDSFIDEYQPEGGVEIALVDTMAQAYFLQLYWTEESVKRTRAHPRQESEEYREWKQYRGMEAKAMHFEHGWWDIPYASELTCQEQATKMADHFSRLFQRTVRQMDNHRLSKAKLKRLSIPTVRRSVVEEERERIKEWHEKIEDVRKAKG